MNAQTLLKMVIVGIAAALPAVAIPHMAQANCLTALTSPAPTSSSRIPFVMTSIPDGGADYVSYTEASVGYSPPVVGVPGHWLSGVSDSFPQYFPIQGTSASIHVENLTTSGAMTIFNWTGQVRYTLNLQCVAGTSNLATATYNGQQFLVSFGPRVN